MHIQFFLLHVHTHEQQIYHFHYYEYAYLRHMYLKEVITDGFCDLNVWPCRLVLVLLPSEPYLQV